MLWCMMIRKSYFDFIWHCIHSFDQLQIQCTMELALDFWTNIQNSTSIWNNGKRFLLFLPPRLTCISFKLIPLNAKCVSKRGKKSTVKRFSRDAVHSRRIYIALLTISKLQTILDCFTYWIHSIKSALRTIGSQFIIIIFKIEYVISVIAIVFHLNLLHSNTKNQTYI